MAREYRLTQEIADVPFFLGYEGLIVPSPRWKGLNLVLFTEHIPPGQLHVLQTSQTPVNWKNWEREHK